MKVTSNNTHRVVFLTAYPHTN